MCVHLFSVVFVALLATAGAASVHAEETVSYLRTRIDPREAGVFVNGKYYGTAAMFGHRERMIKLVPGAYKVEIKDPRYKTLVVQAKIEAGKTFTIRESMESLASRRRGRSAS